MTDQDKLDIEAEIEELRDALILCRAEIGAAFERGRESREPEVAALRFELRHALEFLKDLCLEPDHPQSAVFHMVHSGLYRALIQKAEGS